MKQWMAIIALLAILSACSKVNDGDKTPKIKSIAISKGQVKQGSGTDTVRVSISVADANADLYNDGQTPGIFIKDSRYPNEAPKGFAAPEIDKALMDPAYGFEGTYYVDMSAAFLIFKDTLNSREKDTLQYEIYVKDKAGNESNKAITGNIIIIK